MATRHELTIDQGATWSQELIWVDEETGAPINLTGWTARMQLRLDAEAADPLVELTTANGRIVLGGTAGTVLLLLSATDTTALPAGRLVYDLELVAGVDGEVTRLIGGTAVVTREVTR